jgi:hypothetical protein
VLDDELAVVGLDDLLMKECALFWGDFLRGTEDAGGHYRFCPSYSAENGWADNATQDIARGLILVNRVTCWDMPAGVATAVLTSGIAQKVALVLPRDAVAESITADGKAQMAVEQGVHKQGCMLALPKGKAVTVEVRFRRGK